MLILGFIGKNIYAIVAFFHNNWPSQKDIAKKDFQKMLDMITLSSKIYQLVDAFPGVIVQTLLLLIPFICIKNYM